MNITYRGRTIGVETEADLPVTLALLSLIYARVAA